MAIAPAGYSIKPLAQKLGYRAGQRAAFIALPAGLAELAEAVPFGSVTRAANWGGDLPARSFDLIHAFTTVKADLDGRLIALQAALSMLMFASNSGGPDLRTRDRASFAHGERPMAVRGRWCTSSSHGWART